MSELISLNTTPPSTSKSSPFENFPTSTCVLKVPAESVQAYKAANYWKEFKNIVGIVTEIKVESVALSAKTLTLTVGDTERLTATVKPDNASNKNVTWSSSFPSVATVSSSGLVTAKSAGTATITCKAADGSGKTATCLVKVNKEMEVDITGLEGTYYVTSSHATVTNPTKTYTDDFEMVITKKSDGYWITSMFGEDLTENNDGGFKLINNGNGRLSADIAYTNILSYNSSTGYLYGICVIDETTDELGDYWNMTFDGNGNLKLDDFYVAAFSYNQNEDKWYGGVDALYYDMTGKKNVAPTTKDKMTLAAVTGKSGATVTLPVSLTNEEVISGFQFSLALPSGVSVADAEMANRASKLTPSYNLSNGLYKFSVLSLNGKTVSGNDGVVMNVVLNIASTVKEGNYTMTLKDIKLFAENGAEIAVADNSAKLTIKNYMLGDVNGNGEVNTNDAIAIVNHVIGKEQSVFIEEAADVNGNSEINTNDAIAIVNYVIGKSSSLNSKKHLGLAESILMEKIKKEKVINNYKTLK